MANTLKFGANEWATKDGSILAYNDENNNFKPLPFTFERGSVASVVGKDGLIKIVGANEPRVDYKDSTDGAMLLEPQRRNDIAYSQDLESWSTTGTITKTNNVHISPDGTQNAATITSNASGFDRITQTISVSTNSTYTASLFIKKEQTQTNYMGIGFIFTGGTTDVGYVIFDAINGVAVSADARIDVISEVKDFGNYWKLISTATDNGSNTSLTFNLYATLSTNGTTTGIGISSPRTIWGVQLEQGSYATSLINTSGSAVTRLADSCSQLLPNVDSFNSSNGFSLVAEFGSGAAGSGTSSPFMLFNDRDTSSTYIGIGSNSSSFRCRLNIDGTAYLNTLPNAPRTNDENKIFISCDANGWSQGGNGVVAFNGNDNTSVLNSIGLINILTSEVYGVIRIKKIELYNTRLTDQELIELTKI